MLRCAEWSHAEHGCTRSVEIPGRPHLGRHFLTIDESHRCRGRHGAPRCRIGSGPGPPHALGQATISPRGSMRPSGRVPDQLREITLEIGYAPQAEGSCLIRAGNTHVLCTATVQERVPPFLRRIGRSLRAITDLEAVGERQVLLDCDVLRADGGTRTAAITGAYVALHQAFQRLVDAEELPALPLREPVAAVACGIVDGEVRLDLDYAEDSTAQADANFVLTGSGGIVEIQLTAETEPLGGEQFAAMHALAQQGVGQLLACQRRALGLEG